MSFLFYLGPSGAGKSYHINQDMIRESMLHEDTDYLLIVPDQFTMQTQRDIVEQHPRGGIMNIDVLSFGRLSHRIFEELGDHGRTVMDDTGKNLILRKLCFEHEKELKFLGRNIRRQGYIHEIKSSISEFKQYGIKPDELEKMAEYSQKKALLYGKLKDLQLLYHLFESYKREHYITTEETLELLAEEIQNSAKIRKSVVIFDGFTGFTPVQYRVIEAILLCAKKVIFSFTVGENPGNEVKKDEMLNGTSTDTPGGKSINEQDLFYLTNKNIEGIRKRAGRLHVAEEASVLLFDESPYRYRNNALMNHLEKHIFRYSNQTFLQDSDALNLFEAADMREEIREVCINIKALTTEQGVSYSDIAVVAGNPEVYVPIVRQEFTRYGIPFFSDATKSFDMNPFTELLKSVLSIYNTNFSYEAVFHFLRCGLSGFQPEETDLLENYVRARGIRGKQEWSRRFVYKTVETGNGEEILSLINSYRERLIKILEPLNGLAEKQTAQAREYTELLYQFCVQIQVSEQLEQYAARFREQNDFAGEKEFSQTYRLIMDLFHQIAVLLPDEEITLPEYTNILEAGFSEIRVGLLPGRLDYVLVGDIERTRLKEVKVLFFIGVNDGVIPKKGSHGGIFSDIEREFLEGYGVEMAPTPRQQMYTQRFYLYMNMTKPTQRLYVSYIRVNEKGEAVRPAYLIEELRRMFPRVSIRHPENEDWRQKLYGREDSIPILAAYLSSLAVGRANQRKYVDAGKKDWPVLPCDGSNVDEERQFRTLWQLCNTEDSRLLRLEEAAFCSYHRQKLPALVAEKLYGEVVRCSVSRLEQFAACAYAHFIRYGLELKEREEYSFESQDVGSLYHEALMQFGQSLETDGLGWSDFSEEYATRIIDRVVDGMADDYHGAILRRSARNEFMVQRMKEILHRSVMTVSWQLAAGEFHPVDYEARFEKIIPIDGDSERRMDLQGRIDRIDVCEKQDYCLVKVQDYKSGKKEFNLKDFFNGLQLQLPVYMNAALEMTKKSYPDKEVKPAAMLYYHIADPLVDASEETDGDTSAERGYELLKQTGIVTAEYENLLSLDRNIGSASKVIPGGIKQDQTLKNDDSALTETEQKTLSEYTEYKIKELADSIMNGENSVLPFSDEKTHACMYCSYREICGFDRLIPGYQSNRDQTVNTKDEWMEQMKQKMTESSE